MCRKVSERQQSCPVTRRRTDEVFIFVYFQWLLQKNVLWEGVKVGLERQKLKGYVACLPSIQCDSPFPGSNAIGFYSCAYEFRNKSKLLNPGKNIKNFFYLKAEKYFFFFMERYTQEQSVQILLVQ